jgi:hypothetical protein
LILAEPFQPIRSREVDRADGSLIPLAVAYREHGARIHSIADEGETVPRICVFDVNETLLDLGALDPHFERVFGDAAVRQTWFNQLLQSALVATVTDAYSDFGTIGSKYPTTTTRSRT